MEIDLSQTSDSDRYKILASLVTPRPIAWVTTLNEDGGVNAAPFSFFNVFGSAPPLLGFAPGNRSNGDMKDTPRNLRRTGEFVVHMVEESMAAAMNATAAALPYGTSEVESTGLATVPSSTIKTPRLRDAAVAFECREWGMVEVGGNRLILGIIQHVHVRDGILNPDNLHLDSSAYAPIGRMESPDGYCRTTDRFRMGRPG
jgi:flavin reductase (DIM6/NTAB) family NADH-FMN oxidoreductase RutF